MLVQCVIVVIKKGDIIGIIGLKLFYILLFDVRKKVVDIKEMFIDIGVFSCEEVMEWGVFLGDQVVLYFEFIVMNNEKYLLVKVWDNCIGCVIVIDVLKNLKNSDYLNEVYGVGMVQEEVGFCGVKIVVYIIQFDIVFGVDVGIVGDILGIFEKEV